MKPPRDFTTGPGGQVIGAWRREATLLDGIEGISARDVMYSIPGESPVVLRAAAVTPSFPTFAGERPILGRSFVEADGAPGAEPVASLSEDLWRTRFGGERTVLGTRMTIDGVPHTIVGVMPSTLRLPARIQPHTDVWTALDVTGPNAGGEAIARLRPGISAAAAEQEMDAIMERNDEEGGRRIFNTKVTGLTEGVRFRDSLWMFAVAVALVLLIACGNVAHMLLAQATARERELAVRRALGAGRGRIVRLLLTESLVLAAMGCAAGVLVAWAGLELLMAFRPPALTHLAGIGIDARALSVAAGLSLITGIAFGLFASLHAMRRPAQASLKAAGTAASGGRRQHRMRGMLIVSEIAISAVLLVGATLLLRTVWNLQQVDPGFEPKGAYAMRLSVPFERYEEGLVRRAFYEELVERSKRIPGVSDASVAAQAPPGARVTFGVLEAEDRQLTERPKTSMLRLNYVQPEYFRVLGMRFLAGGPARDTVDVVISRAAAQHLWPDETAVGRRFRTSAKGRWYTVAGVIADEASAGFGEPAEPMLYFVDGEPHPAMLIVRASEGTDPTNHLRQLVMSMDPLIPAAAVSSLESDLARLIARQQFTMMLLVVFTAVAVLLSAVGLYGVMSYAVAQRTREIGVRVALGATQRQIARDVVSNGLLWTLGGLAIGVVGAWWATRFIESMLFGIERTDVFSFAIGAVVLIAIAVLACLVPARRAAGVDPLIAMRVE